MSFASFMFFYILFVFLRVHVFITNTGGNDWERSRANLGFKLLDETLREKIEELSNALSKVHTTTPLPRKCLLGSLEYFHCV